ncbi:MAG: hypothetical protein HKN91_08150 [Acidimicrobiia bacterium]|nr:hypothetical protein [Acidimicrobiia bacterium]
MTLLGVVLAHVGGRTDLPVPLSFFVVGAGLAIVVSFVMLSSSWLEPRMQGDYRRTTYASRWLRRLGAVTAFFAALGLGLVIANGILDGAGSTRAIAPILVWIFFWLAIPFTSVLVGGLWQAANPYRRVVQAVSSDIAERPEWIDRVGVWPAVVLFMAFVWLELVYPSNTTPQTLAIAAVAYGVYLVGLSRLMGPQTAMKTGAAFETYTGLISKMAPVEMFSDSRDERRGWLRALPSMPIHRGTTAFVIAMIGTVTYDGMSGASWWADLVGDSRREVWFETIALVGTVLAIGLLYYLASLLASRLASGRLSAVQVANSFAHTLVPIAFAYAFAHYFTLILYEGQQLIHVASDPFGQGWDLLGTVDWRIVFGPSQAWVWYVQVAVIVVGHIAGVVLAHDRALGEFGGEVAVRTQYAMLVLMVALTSLGLFILAG